MAGPELTLESRPWRSEDAALYVQLAADAFRIVSPWARPKDSVEFVARMHSELNPSGRAIVAIAHSAGRAVGHFSAIPWRLLCRDGRTATGWQLSCFAIAADLQRAGVGTKLVGAVLQAVAAQPADFAFVYPNPRSLGVFLRHGGRYLDQSETLICLPRKRRTLTTPDGSRLSCTPRTAHDVAPLVQSIPEVPTRPGNFVKDRSWFVWRHLGPDADARTRFVQVHGASEHFVLVLASHRVRGIEFTVLVDVYPDILPDRYALVLEAARYAGGGRPVYLTTNLRRRVASAQGAPWTISVPRWADPRSVGTMIMPKTTLADEDLAHSAVLTGDWMSF